MHGIVCFVICIDRYLNLNIGALFIASRSGFYCPIYFIFLITVISNDYHSLVKQFTCVSNGLTIRSPYWWESAARPFAPSWNTLRILSDINSSFNPPRRIKSGCSRIDMTCTFPSYVARKILASLKLSKDSGNLSQVPFVSDSEMTSSQIKARPTASEPAELSRISETKAFSCFGLVISVHGGVHATMKSCKLIKCVST